MMKQLYLIAALVPMSAIAYPGESIRIFQDMDYEGRNVSRDHSPRMLHYTAQSLSRTGKEIADALENGDKIDSKELRHQSKLACYLALNLLRASVNEEWNPDDDLDLRGYGLPIVEL